MMHRFVVRGRSALLCLMATGAIAGCDVSPEAVTVADAGVALPDGSIALPDGGLSAADAGLPTAAESDGLLTLAEFRGVVDVADGSMKFEMLEGDEVTSPSLRRMQQGLCALTIIQDGVPGSGPADSLELVTDSTGLDAACTGYAASPIFCGDVTIRSFYTAAKNDLYAQITTLVPSTGYAVQNGDSIPGASSGLGSFSYGNLTAAPGPGNSATRPWVFARAGGNFTFQGRVVVNIVEQCNGVDEDCDGLIDENAGCFAAGTACAATADCAAGLDCNSGVCGTPGGAGSACVTTANCNAGLTCLSSVCTAVGTPAAAGDVLVTEIMPRSISGTGDLGEWFEIYNPTTSYWDLSTCSFDDNNSTNLISSLTLPATGANTFILPPGGYRVFAQSAVAAENHGLTPDFVYDPLIALSNTADLIRIKCGTTLIDEVSWTASSAGFVALSKSAQLDRSISGPIVNDDLTNWCTPSTPTYSTGFSGTPGTQNVSCFVNQVIDRCRLAPPTAISQIASTTANVFGRVRILGLTDQSGLVDLNGLVKMQAGYGAPGSDASTWTNWSASGVASVGYGTTITTEAGFDEYRATLTLPATVGNYDFAVRFTGDNGATWTYCDKSAGAGADGSENGYQVANAGSLISRAAPNHPGAGGLVITELMVAAQSGTPDDGEWIEVYNPSTTETYDLDGCSISDGTSSVGVTTTTLVPPQSYFLFGRSTDSAVNFGAPVDFAWGVAFQLNNSGESPTITCGSTVVDTLAYPQLFEREQGASFQLHPGSLDAVSNDAATTAWCNSRTTFGSFGKKGTPKAANPSCNVTIGSCQLVTPVTAQTGYAGATATVAAVYSVAGLTGNATGADYATRIVGEAAIGPDGSNPTVSTSNWSFNLGGSDLAFSDPALDRSVATATFPAVGSYDIAYRMSGDGGATWTYCDTTNNLSNADYAAADSVALTTTTPPGPPTAAGDIIFSEVMASSGLGSTGSPAVDRGEWVEIHNTTASDLNLAGCTITDGEASTTITGSLVVVAGGYAILGQEDNASANGGMTGVALNYDDLLNLSNSGDNLELSCGTLVLDAFTYPSSFATAGRSKQLAPDRFTAGLNDNTGNWCGTTGAVFAGTRTGTPGAANTACFLCRAEAPSTATGIAGSLQSLTARIKIPGLTDGANVQSGPQVQFGTGPDGSNPSTTDLVQWSFAAGAGTVGWNGTLESLYDEYTGSFTMPATGGDWAARVSGDGGVSWTYCDRNVGAGADGSENGYQPANAGTVAPTATYTITDCSVVAPTSVSAAGGTAAAVRGQVVINGVTDATTGVDTNSSVLVQAAYGADATLPSGWSNWVTATGDATFSDATADAYDASLTVGLTTGSYDFAFRVSGDAGTSWTYCDTTGGTYAANDAGALTVTPGTNQNYTVTDCSIAAPTGITGTVSTTASVVALVQIAGLTDYSSGLNLASTVQVELGQGADGSDPTSWTGWASATGDGSFINASSDRYGATLTLPSAPGASDFAFRVTGDGGATWTYCDSTGGTYAAADAGSITANPNAFLAGNFLVQVMGDGSAALSGSAATIGLREYGSTGSLVSTVTTPFTSTSLLTDSGTATSNGYFGVLDGRVAVPGINAATGTASVAALNQKAVNILGADRTLATRVTFPTGGPTGTPVSPFSGNNFRSVIPASATTFYAGGTATGLPSTGGVWYYDGSAFVQISSTATGQPTNVRMVGLFGGQLYLASSTGTFLGISSLGQGLPMTAGQTATLVINMGTGASPYGFAFADTNKDGTNDRVYIADDRTTTAGGLYRYDLVSGVWTLRWNRLFGTSNTLTTTAGTGVVGGRGLSMTYDAGSATIVVSTADSTGNRLVKIVDSSADGSTVPTSYTTLVTAGANTIIRGVAVFNDCGDGRVDGAEVCDDGNSVDSDTCSNSCLPARCGDGITQSGESCDDGNAVNTDACTNVCAAARCGDGFVQGSEVCDDGNSSNTDACTNACSAPACGDGFVQGSEVCDDGNSSNTDLCTNVCAAPACGDGFVQGSEACDDANLVNTDSCTNVCAAAACGDGFVQGSEACDDGNAVDADTCSNSCGCGTGYHLELGACFSDTKSCTVANGSGTQTWDGGNSAYGTCTATACDGGYHVESGACASDTRACVTLPADAASGTESWTGSAYGACVIATCDAGFALVSNACVGGCGNNITAGGETCDDGNTVTEECAYGELSCSVCNASCQTTAGETDFCTDGTLDASEFCDDGNGSNADSCSNSCTCGTGYHAEAGICANDVQACTINNGTATETWNGSSYGLCTLTACNSGYHANGNVCDADVIACSPLPSNTTAGTQTWNSGTSSYGTCTATTCASTYHVESGVCVSDTRTCSAANATAATESWDGGAWGTCTATACDATYHIEFGTCVSDTRSCSITNGTGTQTYASGAWGTCTVASCNSTYHAESNACVSDTRTCSPLPANATAGTETYASGAWGSCTVSQCEVGRVLASNNCSTVANLLVQRNGIGSAALGSAAQPVALLEYSQTPGAVVSTTNLDTTGANQLTDTGSGGSNGYMNTRGPWLSVGGYNSAAGTASVAGTNTKVVHLYNGTLSSYTRVLFATDATIFGGNNFRSSVPVSATQFYATGTGSGVTGGVWYYTGSAFTQISTTVTNLRNVEIYGGNLYFSTGSGTSRGIYQVGTGLPTSSATTSAPLVVTGSTTDPYGFVLFDTNADSVMDLAYVCDGTAGLQKWVYTSGAWAGSAAWALKITAAGTTLGATGNACNGLTGTYASGSATLYFAENITGSSGNNRIMKVVDSGTQPTSATTIATAGANYVFRGVDFKGF